MSSREKVIVLGIDGASFRLIEPWMKKGRLPKMKYVMDVGCTGALKCVPLTPPSWTSIVTGKRPENHGIHTFRKIKYDYSHGFYSSRDKKSQELWDYIEKSIVINVPMTYPVREIDGVLISGMMTPTLESDCVYPEIEKEYLKEVGYVIEPDLELQSIEESLLTRIKVMFHYLKRDWNLFFIVFREFDPLQHSFWSNAFRYYKIFDNALEKILNLISDDMLLLIVSDHGFIPVKKGFYSTNWLLDQGYVRIVADKRVLPTYQFEIKEWLTKSVIKYRLNRFIPSPIRHALSREVGLGRSEYLKEIIDFKNSKILPIGYGELCVNLKSRFKWGNVAESEIEELINEVKTKLENLRDHSGKRIMRLVERKNYSSFSSDKSNEQIDLQFFVNTKEGYTNEIGFGAGRVIGVTTKKTDHTPDGIFMACGSKVKKGKRIENIESVDVVPTILHFLRRPIPTDLDGKIINEIFSKDRSIDS